MFCDCEGNRNHVAKTAGMPKACHTLGLAVLPKILHMSFKEKSKKEGLAFQLPK